MRNIVETGAEEAWFSHADGADVKVAALCPSTASPGVCYYVLASGSTSHPDIVAFPLSSPDDRIVAAEYLIEQDTISACTLRGDLFVGSEIVGSVDSGILTMAWSPDQDLCVVLTGRGSIIIFSKDWDLLSEIVLDGEGVPSDEMQAQASISWRGDGKFFSVASSARVFVYDRTGTLESKAETSISGSNNGMVSLCSWRPSGSIIVQPQVDRIRCQFKLIFIEKNGLQHYDTVLEESVSADMNVTVRDLKWNAASDLLAASYGNKVAILTRSNYHWYRKRELPFDDAVVQWDPVDPSVLYVAQANEYQIRFVKYCFRWRVDVAFQADATCYVIDGKSVNLTDFRKAVIPPPMFSRQRTFPCQVCHLAVDRMAPTAVWAAQLVDGHVHVSNNRSFSIADVTKNSLSILVDVKQLDVGVSCFFADGSSVIETVLTSSADDTVGTINSWSLSASIVCVSFPYVLTSDKKVHRLGSSGHSMVRVAMPSICDQMLVFADSTGEDLLCAFASDRGSLYVHGEKLTDTCTSIAMHDDFFLFTTAANWLYILPRHDMEQFASKRIGANILMRKENGREVERGALLVCAMFGTPRVVLQMPRGNLETIQPRILVEWYLKILLQQESWLAAVQHARKHKLEMDLIPALLSSPFDRYVSQFVAEVTDPDLHDLFLTQQRDTDIDRKNDVCRALRFEYLSNDTLRRRFFLPTLSSFARESPPDVEGALTHLAKYCLRTSTPDFAFDRALAHLSLFVHVDILYQSALGTYDLDLASKVAEKTQQDPREYLPFIANLRSIEPPAVRHFEIDCHLQRYERAIGHATEEASLMDRVVDLVSKHKLYSRAVSLFPDDRRIALLYGDYLHSLDKWSDAGECYLLAQEMQKAIDVFVKAGEWRRVVSLSSDIGIRQQCIAVLEDMHKYRDAMELAVWFCDDVERGVELGVRHQLWEEAHAIAIQHQRRDLVTTIVQPALVAHGRLLVSQAAESSVQFAIQLQELKAARLRLEEEARQRALGIAHVVDDEEDAHHHSSRLEDADRFSEASTRSRSSRASRSSNRSNASSTASKRQARRLQQRAGPEFAEENALRIIRVLMPTNDHQLRLQQVLRMLILYGETGIARDLQKAWLAFERSVVKPALPELSKPVREVVLEGFTPEALQKLNVAVKASDVEGTHLLFGNVAWSFSVLHS
jgi:elongator complex protein 1